MGEAMDQVSHKVMQSAELAARHRKLDTQITELTKATRGTAMELSLLKREKLRLKEKLAGLRH
jgi:uncharacterized protein YdcH (DUF465 family)